MAYVKQNFTDGNILYAEEMIHIEDGIAALEQSLSSARQDILNEVLESIPTDGGGIIPTGTITLKSNGTHNVSQYEFAKVDVDINGDIVYGENIEVDSLSELHAWNKYIIEGTTTRTTVTRPWLGIAQRGEGIKVTYANAVDTSSGSLTLSADGYGTVVVYSMADGSVLKGKAVAVATTNGANYYEIPKTATIEFSKGANEGTFDNLYVNEATKVTHTSGGDSFVCIVVSEDSTAYPQNGTQDGYKYVYNGTLNNVSGCDHVAVTQAVPSITVSESGLITATSEQDGGLVAAGIRTTTQQLSTQGGVAVKPGSTSKTAVAAGKYTTGDVIVMGDPDLVADNIRSGVDIFGVTGTYGGNGSVDTSDATLAAEQDLISGVVAYGKDGKRVVGTAKDSRAWYGTYSAEPEIYTSGEYKYVMFKTKPSEPTMVRDTVELCARVSKFGDATAGDVVKGKTFTSKDGLKVTGTIEEYGDDGNSYGWEGAMPCTTEQGIGLSGTARSDMLFRKGCKFTLTAQPSNFGDATAADVLAGKTFTSAAGVKVVGTMPPGSFTVTDDGAGNVTITSSAITDNDGNVVIA